MFVIRVGVPEMLELWNSLTNKVKDNTASKTEIRLYKKLGKTMKTLSDDPRYPGPHTHGIDALTARYGIKVWESYLENNTPAAGRLFWVYGPEKGEITVIGLEPHPNDKAHSYNKITLSSTGEDTE